MADIQSSIYVVSALAGNAWRESHINPTVGQQGGTAFGIFQWDGTRKTALKNWLIENGYSDVDPYGQMKYLIVENDWQGSYGGISSLTDFMSSDSTNITTLTRAFCYCWERPGKPATQERINFANKALSYIAEHANDASITGWETEPMYYLTENQALKNAVLMYRYYSGGVTPPPHPTPTGEKKKMPVWMMVRHRH